MPPSKPLLPAGLQPAPASGCVQIGGAAASPSIRETDAEADVLPLLLCELTCSASAEEVLLLLLLW